MDQQVTTVTPKLSILLATKNRAHSLRLCIQEILAEKNTDFELVVLNNGSTDNTAKVLASFRDDRLRVLEGEENLGLYGFVTLTRHARGDVFCFVSDEDSLNFKNIWLIVERLITSAEVEVIVADVIYGDYWRLIRYGADRKLVGYEAYSLLLGFSGLAGVFVRNSEASRSPAVSPSSAYREFNFYPIGYLAAQRIRRAVSVQNLVVAVQTRFEQTTDFFLPAPSFSVGSTRQPHYYPASMVDRFRSQVDFVNQSDALSTFEKGKACAVFSQSLQSQFNAIFDGSLSLIRESYSPETVERYLEDARSRGLHDRTTRNRVVREESMSARNNQSLMFNAGFISYRFSSFTRRLRRAMSPRTVLRALPRAIRRSGA